MLIRRSLEHHGNLLPAAYNALQSIPAGLPFHDQHGMRHPKSAYGTSLRLISDQWAKFAAELDLLHKDFQLENKTDRHKAVVAEYAELLFRLNEHLDACFAALRCMCPASASKATRFDSQFLDKANPPGWKKFKDSIRLYREDHIGLLANTIKHKQGELCPIFFKSIREFRPGYYLRDILPGGLLGPSEKLHSGGNTAFSFARDSLIHLWWLYRIGELLSDAVTAILTVAPWREAPASPNAQLETKWEELLCFCARTKPEFFPDELKKPYPRVVLQPLPKAVSLEFPARVRGIPLPRDTTVSTQFVVDGEHLGNKLPYLARNRDDA